MGHFQTILDESDQKIFDDAENIILVLKFLYQKALYEKDEKKILVNYYYIFYMIYLKAEKLLERLPFDMNLDQVTMKMICELRLTVIFIDYII